MSFCLQSLLKQALHLRTYSLLSLFITILTHSMCLNIATHIRYRQNEYRLDVDQRTKDRKALDEMAVDQMTLNKMTVNEVAVCYF
jgi:hypothetical protein